MGIHQCSDVEYSRKSRQMMSYHKSQSTYHIIIIIIGFVDDKRQYTNDWLHNCLDTVTNNLREAAQGWEYLLHTVGGQLELTKYAWY